MRTRAFQPLEAFGVFVLVPAVMHSRGWYGRRRRGKGRQATARMVLKIVNIVYMVVNQRLNGLHIINNRLQKLQVI